MKTKQWIGALFALLITLSVAAQEHDMYDKMEHRKGKMEKVEAMKVGYFTKKLDLDAETAAKFWPVFNAYDKEVKALRHGFKEKMMKSHKKWDELSDKQKNDLLLSRFEMESKQIEIGKKYHEKFKSVLTLDQMGKLYHAEEAFKKHLIQEMHDKRKVRKEEHRKTH